MKPDITSGRGILSRKIRAPVLLLALLFSGGFQAAEALPGAGENHLLITVDQLRSLPKDEVVILDTRSKWKYFLGHIPGAVHPGDWRDFSHEVNEVPGILIEDKKVIAEKLRSLGISLEKLVVVYGDSRDPWRTDGRFFWMFERYGFPKVAILKGGYQFWKKSGGTVERGGGTSPAASSLKPEDIRFNPEVYADKEWILQRLGTESLAIIDNRTRVEYDGATPYGSRRGGRIPGAIHIDWREFFDSRGLMKDAGVLSGLLEKYGIRPGKEIVVYCTGGVRSAMAYFVLRYLGYSVRNYDGSWWDWSRASNLPVETS